MKKVIYGILCVLSALFFLSGCVSVNRKTVNQDFYGFVHDTWLSENRELIDALPHIDSPAICMENITQAFIAHFDGSEPADELESMLFDTYRSALDFELRTKADYSWLHSYLEKIESAATIEDLVSLDSDIFRETGLSTLISFYRDMLSFSGTYFVTVFEPVIFGPDTESTIAYYRNLLEVLGVSKDQDTFDGAVALYTQQFSLKEQQKDFLESSINFTNLTAQFGSLDLKKICDERNIIQTGYMTKQPNLDLSALVSLLLDSDVDYVRTYMEVSLLSRIAPFLSEDIAENFFAFLGLQNRLYQSDLVSCTKRYMVQYMCSNWYPLMELIFDRYIVPSESLQDVQTIANDIRARYLEVLDGTTLFNEATVARIRRVVERFEIIVGLPLRDVSYYSVCSLDRENLWNCITSVNKFTDQYVHDSRVTEHEPLRGKYTSYTVNAFAGNLSITIMGGYLMNPNYSADMTTASKYGAIGSVIGHELSHAWRAGTVYNKPIDGYDRMISLYDGYPEYSGVICNGKQVSSEAAADIFGLQVALYALEQLESEPDYESFFMGYALLHQSEFSKEYDDYRMNVIKDAHPLDRCRVNCSVWNFDQFYSTFDVHPGNTMYLPEDKRFRL